MCKCRVQHRAAKIKITSNQNKTKTISTPPLFLSQNATADCAATCKRIRLQLVANLCSAQADGKWQGGLCGYGGGRGQRGRTQKRLENEFERNSTRGASASVTRLPFSAAHLSSLASAGCGVGERELRRGALGTQVLEFLPFRFPHRRGQRRERVCPLKWEGGNSRGGGGCKRAWAGQGCPWHAAANDLGTPMRLIQGDGSLYNFLERMHTQLRHP